MNLVLNNVRGTITYANSYYLDSYGSFGNFDYVMANPPFNVDCVELDQVKDQPRFNTYGVPLVTGRCISSGYVDFDATYSISETDHVRIKKLSGLKSGDILFSNIGTVGNCCIVDYNREFSGKNVIIFKPKTMRDTTYLYYWMTSLTMQKIFCTQTNSASQQFVGLTFMRRYKLLVPKDDILEAFVGKVFAYCGIKATVTSEKSKSGCTA